MARDTSWCPLACAIAGSNGNADNAVTARQRGPDMLLHRDVTERVLNSYYVVYDDRGYGFAEGVYVRSLVVELQSRGLRVAREVETKIFYKGVEVGLYRADLIVEGKVLVEVKATEGLVKSDERQVLNYLKATGLQVGLLLNFGPKPSFRRLVLSSAG
jgi:GxxExxY protein